MSEVSPSPQTLAKQDFAALIQRSPSYVTALIRANRIALTEDGKRVLVAESLAMLEASKGNRDDVARRHAAARAGVQTLPPDEPVDPAVRATLRNAAQEKALNEARISAAKADKEEMERDKMAGNLVPREAVEYTLKMALATFGSLMDTFPDQVAPLVGPVGIDEAHSVLADRCRAARTEMADVLRREAERLKQGGDV